MIIPPLVLMLTFTSVFIQVGSVSVQKAGPFELNLRFVENCEELPSHEVFMTWKFNKINRTTLQFSVTISSTLEFGDNLKLKANFAVMTNQGWKENFYHDDYGGVGLCTALRKVFPESHKAFLSSVVPPVDGCPFPPGNHTAEFSANVLPPDNYPQFFYNKYKVTNSLLNNSLDGPEVGCSKWYVDFVPRRRRAKQKKTSE